RAGTGAGRHAARIALGLQELVVAGEARVQVGVGQVPAPGRRDRRLQGQLKAARARAANVLVARDVGRAAVPILAVAVQDEVPAVDLEHRRLQAGLALEQREGLAHADLDVGGPLRPQVGVVGHTARWALAAAVLL